MKCLYLLALLLQIAGLACVREFQVPQYNTSSALWTRDEFDGVFTDAGPIFIGFPEDNQLLNAVKTAIIDAFYLAYAALQQAQANSDIYLRYFKEENSCGILNVFAFVLGPDGKGTNAMRDPSMPLHILWKDKTLIGDSGVNTCDNPDNVASFNPLHPIGPLLLLCPPTFFGPGVNKLSLQAWEAEACDDIPDFMSVKMDIPGLTLLHEFLHWHQEVFQAAQVRILDYGMTSYGYYWEPPDENAPKDGYGAYNCYKMNQRDDIETHRNADSYAWMAMEAWLKERCPDKTILPPPPPGPAEYTDPRDYQDPTPET